MSPSSRDLEDRPHQDHPEKPDSPTDIRKPSWKYVLRSAVSEFLDDQCTDLAAALTYYSVLSIFPALVALVSILSLVGQGTATQDIVGMLEGKVPQQSLDQVEGFLESITSAPGAGIGLVIGLLVALWTASNYVNAFSRAMNRIYEVPEGRPIWKLRPWVYLLTVIVIVLVAIAALLLVLTGPVARTVGDIVGLGSTAVTVWNIAKWPVLLLVVIGIIALLYHATPNVKQPKFRWVSVGAVIAIVIAAIASAGFGFYVANFGSYDETYGALGAVIVFLLWLWIMNLALLFGAEVDAELERGRELQAGMPAEEHIQLPPRDTRASDKKAARAEKMVEKGRALRESGGRTLSVEDAEKMDDGGDHDQGRRGRREDTRDADDER